MLVDADRLVEEPQAVVRRYCEETGLPFIESALQWQPGDRPEWGRTRQWHLDAMRSSGFAATQKTYPETVANNATLKGYFDHHYPFYRQARTARDLIVRRAFPPIPFPTEKAATTMSSIQANAVAPIRPVEALSSGEQFAQAYLAKGSRRKCTSTSPSPKPSSPRRTAPA